MQKKAKTKTAALVTIARIEETIHSVRGEPVMIDAELADLYGVDTKTLVRAVKRNLARFPAEFMFLLTREEFEILRYQIGTSRSWGGRRYPPYAFTEHGVAMLSSVLRSDRAVKVNIAIIQTFVRLRRLLASNLDLARKVQELERSSKKHDAQLTVVFQAMKRLMIAAVKDERPPKRPVGFRNPK